MNAPDTVDVSDPATWGPGIDEAVHVVSRGGLVVLPTDTVYGIGADAFTPPAVAALLAAAWYAAGDGPRARVAADVALEIDPANSLAGVVGAGLDSGLEPHVFREVIAQAAKRR